MDVVRNTITAGAGACSGAAGCIKRGLISTARVGRIDRNRFYGGVSPTGQGYVRTVALYGAPPTATFTNNMVYAASVSAAATSNQIALEIANSPGMTVAHNTIFSGSSPLAIAMHVSSTAGIAVEDNIVLAGGGNSYGLFTYSCNGQPFSRLRNNLFLNVANPGHDTSGTGCVTANPLGSLTILEGHYAKLAPGAVSNNVIVASACTGETSKCVVVAPCTKPANNECLRAIFAGWTDADAGLTEWRLGWKLKPGTCAASRRGLAAPTADSAFDFFGTPRVAPTSIGAHELVETCGAL